jgi:hypothetical protein
MKMKNVMVRAWEIAKKGAAKFGGKVKDYFAQALRMAWAEIKKGVKKMEIGYELVRKLNGTIQFVTNDVEGMQSSFLTDGFNGMNRTTFVKRNALPYKNVVNKVTGEKKRLYNIAINAGDIEIKLGEEVVFIENYRHKN